MLREAEVNPPPDQRIACRQVTQRANPLSHSVHAAVLPHPGTEKSSMRCASSIFQLLTPPLQLWISLVMKCIPLLQLFWPD